MTAQDYEARYGWRARDLRDVLDDELPEREWVIPGLLERGRHLVLPGPAGSAKTILALQAVTQAIQTNPDQFPWDLGLDILPLRHVTIFDAEMGGEQYHRQLRSLGLDRFICPDHIRYVDAAGLDIYHPTQGLLDLDYMAQASEGSDLVIVDSLKRIAPSAQENDTNDMSAVVSSLTHLAHQTNQAFWTIHHWGHEAQRFRGSSTILDAADALVAWKSHGDTKYRALTTTGRSVKVRGVADQPDRWFRQLDSGLIVPAPEGPPTSTTAEPKWDALIRELLPFEGSQAALAKKCGTTSTNHSWRDAYDRVAMLADGVHVAHETAIPDGVAI